MSIPRLGLRRVLTAAVAAIGFLALPATPCTVATAAAGPESGSSSPSAGPTTAAGRLPAFRTAADLGVLSVAPLAGTADSAPIAVGTPAGMTCPAPTTTTAGYLIGPTAAWSDPATPVTALPPARAGGAATVARMLGGSLRQMAAAARLPLVAGRYQLVLQCGSEGLADVYGQFTAPFWLAADGRWRASDPASGTAAAGPRSEAGSGSSSTAPAGAATGARPSRPGPATSSTTPTGTTSAPSASSATAATAATAAPRDTAPRDTGPTGATATRGPAALAARSAAVRLLAASAAPLGTLTLRPTEGSSGANTAFDLTPPAGTTCPTGTITYRASLIGPTTAWQQLDDMSISDGYGGASGTGVRTRTIAQFASSHALAIDAGKYTVALVCYGDPDFITSLGQFEGYLWFTDASHWQATDPATSQTDTTVTMVSDPLIRGELGKPVRITAKVAPSTAVGAVQFGVLDNSGGLVPFPPKANDTDAPTTQPVDAGTATYSSSSLAVGLYPFKATFIPSDTAKYTGSTSAVPVYFAVVPPLPPTPGGPATLSGTATSGHILTCAGSFSGATSTSWIWISDYDTPLESTTNTFQLTDADRGHTIRCRALATNAGGTIGRTSAAVRVAP